MSFRAPRPVIPSVAEESLERCFDHAQHDIPSTPSYRIPLRSLCSASSFVPKGTVSSPFRSAKGARERIESEGCRGIGMSFRAPRPVIPSAAEESLERCFDHAQHDTPSTPSYRIPLRSLRSASSFVPKGEGASSE